MHILRAPKTILSKIAQVGLDLPKPWTHMSKVKPKNPAMSNQNYDDVKLNPAHVLSISTDLVQRIKKAYLISQRVPVGSARLTEERSSGSGRDQVQDE